MSELVADAIKVLRQLPPQQQESIARAIVQFASDESPDFRDA